MAKVFVTTFCRDEMKPEEFIRTNATHNGAWEAALVDAKLMLGEYDFANGDQVLDCVEAEDGIIDASIIRIINERNGHEYEAYIIREIEVGK